MEQIKEANEYPMIRFYPNPDNRSLQETLNNSIVITDEHSIGPLYIQAHLAQRFPLPGFQWVVRAISNNCYLLDPPNPLWKATTLEFRALTLGGIRFPVEVYNKE
jgi:Domain of unknown function (DUF4283)